MRAAAAIAAATLLLPDAAQAHVAMPGVGGFEGGALHPLLVLSHALALVALGLLAGLQAPPARMLMIATLLIAMGSAFGLVSLAYATDRAEFAILTLGAVTGLVLAAFPRAPVGIGVLLSALIGIAILFDSVPAVPSVRETTLALCGTALAAMSIVTVVAYSTAALPGVWPRAGVRVAGSWIAASAILILALRLAKP